MQLQWPSAITRVSSVSGVPIVVLMPLNVYIETQTTHKLPLISSHTNLLDGIVEDMSLGLIDRIDGASVQDGRGEVVIQAPTV